MVKESASRDSSIKKRRSKNTSGDGDQDTDIYKVCLKVRLVSDLQMLQM